MTKNQKKPTSPHHEVGITRWVFWKSLCEFPCWSRFFPVGDLIWISITVTFSGDLDLGGINPKRSLRSWKKKLSEDGFCLAVLAKRRLNFLGWGIFSRENKPFKLFFSGSRTAKWVGIRKKLASLKLTAKVPENWQFHFPTIHFQGLAVGFKECMWISLLNTLRLNFKFQKIPLMFFVSHDISMIDDVCLFLLCIFPILTPLKSNMTLENHHFLIGNTSSNIGGT